MTRPFEGSRIVLGVSGGVAAYKAAVLCRELVRRGAFVSPVLTRSAERFIGVATLSALASEPARTSLWESPEPSPHTQLGQRADLVVVAPATAHLLASAAAGLAGDLLTTTLLATRAPVLLCPAMHTEMWEHPATRHNLELLRSRGVQFVLPEDGELAGGDTGPGRLAEPATVVEACETVLRRTQARAPGAGACPLPPQDMDGMAVLVSAGGTREALDPVRYIGNRSSGRQGHALAAAARGRGATVHLVTTVEPPAELSSVGVRVTRVVTAAQMHEAMLQHVAAADLVVMSAAVADFRPAGPAGRKLKRRDGLPQVSLERTPNVLHALVGARRPGQVVVGFAAETDDLHANAAEKLVASGADLIVANDVSRSDAGFDCDTNAVTILRAGWSEPVDVAVADKRVVADRVLDAAMLVRADADSPQVGGVH